jgi:hypothetical protein
MKKIILCTLVCAILLTLPVASTLIEKSPEDFPNRPPRKPSRPVGEKRGKVGTEYRYSTSAIDPDGDQVFYLFSFGDGTTSGWTGPYASGQTGKVINKWDRRGIYFVRAKAKDIYEAESPWSDPLIVRMPRSVLLFHNILAIVNLA